MLITTIGNIGKGEARNVQINITGTGLFGRTTTYITEIDPNDEEIAMFDLKLLSYSAERTPVTLYLQYEDSEGEHVIHFTDVIFTRPRSRDSTLLIVAGIIILAIIIIFRKNIPLLRDYV